MSAPKSVVKMRTKKGNGYVEYVSSVDQSKYFIDELTRAALRDVGKYVRKTFKDNYYKHFKKHTGDAGKVTQYKVWASKSTKYPRVQIGLKTGRQDGFYAYFQEFGTSDGRVPRLEILQKSVNDNISEIVKIESQYLSALQHEANRLKQLVDEREYESEGEDA